MTARVQRGDREPFPGSTAATAAVEYFCRESSEFCDSSAVVVVAHPDSKTDRIHYMVRISGNPHAASALCYKWVEGCLEDGSWYVGPSGYVAVGLVDPDSEDAQDPLPWADAVQRELDARARWLGYKIGNEQAGVLVLATSGEGPNGSTKAMARTFGNSMACHGALATWLRDRENYE